MMAALAYENESLLASRAASALGLFVQIKIARADSARLGLLPASPDSDTSSLVEIVYQIVAQIVAGVH